MMMMMVLYVGYTYQVLTSCHYRFLFQVIRNEMFKTNLSLIDTVRQLRAQTGWGFLSRGLGKNMLAVAIPVACTIFLTDVFIQMTKQRELDKLEQQ
jgi:hypothetical protein